MGDSKTFMYQCINPLYDGFILICKSLKDIIII